ncbi:MAG: hypothetical protein AB7F28_00130 [Candidatus Margulisiibacteriota bacterium]
MQNCLKCWPALLWIALGVVLLMWNLGLFAFPFHILALWPAILIYYGIRLVLSYFWGE